MNLGNAIFYLLTNDVAVAAIVGNRVFPNRIDQASGASAVVYAIAETEPTDTKDGVSILDIKTFVVWAMVPDHDSCRVLAEAVRRALDRKSGIFSGVDVDSIRFDSGDDDQYDDELQKAFVEMRFKARIRR